MTNEVLLFVPCVLTVFVRNSGRSIVVKLSQQIDS